jgi:predicted DNA-binding transcriptional regulator AlpA
MTYGEPLNASGASTATPLLVPAADAGALSGVSRSSWWALHSSGRCPMPVRLGRKVLWRVDELRAWVAAGCPPRTKWQAMWKAGAA